MKIALAANGKDFNSQVHERFGRADYFIITNDNADAVEEVIENSAKNDATGAGTGAASMIAEKNVSVVVAGNLGPKAEDVLNAAGIKFLSYFGKIADAVEFLKGNSSMENIDQMKTAPDMQRYAGRQMGQGAGRGMGRCSGQGRGMGRGGCQGGAGRGMGRGTGMGRNGSGRM